MRFCLLFLLFLSIPSLASEDIPEAVRQAEKAVWRLSHNQEIDHDQGMGTGFFFGQNLVATNFHVVSRDLKFINNLVKNFKFSQKGLFSDIKLKNLINLSPSHDLAIFKTNKKVSHYLTLPSEDPELTDSIFVIGYPGDSFQILKNTNPHLEVNEYKIIGFFNDLELGGTSGSPALNEKGELIGVAFGGNFNSLEIIRINHLKKLVESKKHSINLSENKHDEIESLIKEKISKVNDPAAQYVIGMIAATWKNKLTKEDLAWVERSAEQDYADAQDLLGERFYEGSGVKQDLKKAVYWIKKAIKGGHIRAQYYLGLMYYYGKGMDQDFKKAFDLMRLTAEQDYTWPQYYLGWMFYNGLGTKKDLEQARYWFERAATRQNNYKAQFQLGMMYYRGEGIEKNLEQAIYWIELAAKQGDAEAQFQLGMMYYRGEGIEKNLEQAIYWTSSSVTIKWWLDSQYPEKRIQHLKKVFRWMEFVAEQGNAEAQFQLAELFYYGLGTKKDLEQARYWYELAAKQGFAPAQHDLGWMYYYGEGVKKDLEQARYWYELAAKQSHTEAQEMLKSMKQPKEISNKCQAAF